LLAPRQTFKLEERAVILMPMSSGMCNVAVGYRRFGGHYCLQLQAENSYE